MKTIEEVKKYLKNELSLREEQMLKYYGIYKTASDKDVKKYSKDNCDEYYRECSLIEKILKDIEG